MSVRGGLIALTLGEQVRRAGTSVAGLFDSTAHSHLPKNYHAIVCIANYLMYTQDGLRKTLYDEHLSHLKETDDQIPYRQGDYFYYTRTIKGKSYKVDLGRRIKIFQ